MRKLAGGFCWSSVTLCALIVIVLTITWAVLVAADPDNRPIIVLREDDIRSSWRTPFAGLGGVSALAYAKSKQIPITWGVVTDYASGWGLTWAELIDYIATAGGELASHSCKHTAMKSEQEYFAELVNSKAIIEANAPGYACTTFLQPGTWPGDAKLDRFSKLNNPIGQAIQANYAQSQAYLGAGWHIGNIDLKYGSTPEYSLDYSPSRTLGALLATLDIIANTPGLVFVFTCHGVQETGGTRDYEVPANILKAFIDRCAELRDLGKVRLMSMHDAFHTVFSPYLNRLADPGFELCSPGPNNPVGPVTCSSGCSLPSSGGVGDSRYMSIPASGWASNSCRLDPGRYRITWYQKRQSGPQAGLGVSLVVFAPGSQYRLAMNELRFTNPTVNEWHQYSALALVPYGFPNARLDFAPKSGTSYGVDSLSIVSEPINPAVSCSGTVVTVSPSQCKIEWDTPPDAVDTIVVRYHNSTHPLTKEDGTLLGTVPAQPGTRQQIIANPFSWTTGSGYFYFSVFAVKEGEAAPPDLAVVIRDSSPPTNPAVQAEYRPDNTILASWLSTDPESGIYQYRYCVGTAVNRDDVIPWTNTFETSAILSGIPSNQSCYLCVKAQNPFGYWSGTSSILLIRPFGIREATSQPDGTKVRVNGIVTAKYNNFHYLGSLTRTEGIRIQGSTPAAEGDRVTVTGTMSTVNGERVIIPD